MGKKQKKAEIIIVDSKKLTGEELAIQLAINYEQMMAAQANIREIQVELNQRNAELESKPKE